MNITGSGLALSSSTVKLDNGGSLNFGGTPNARRRGTLTFTEGSINLTKRSKLTIAAAVTLQGTEADVYNTNLNANSARSTTWEQSTPAQAAARYFRSRAALAAPGPMTARSRPPPAAISTWTVPGPTTPAR